MQQIREKRWIQKKIPDFNLVQKLSTELKISETLASLMVQRNLFNYDAAKQFFNPSVDQLHDPFLMKDMTKAVQRIQIAIDSKERIMIYGDYDVDGTTSVALLFKFFSHLTDQLDCYVPNRFSEGYGVSHEGVEKAIRNKVGLMITIDCGIKDNKEVEFAHENGIDFIICDHHTPGKDIPNALAILNPKQEDCPYPFKDLSGCGIGFKLIQAYQKTYTIDFNPLQLCDLVAVSIASDIVPIVDENRILAYLGLQKINNDPQLPFHVMLENLDIKKELTITDLVFIIGPRLNASGRLSHANNTVEFLINENIHELREIAKEINSINKERQELDQEIVENALEIIEESEDLKNKFSTVLWSADWHKGVIGIVASRLIETYYRPTILLTESEGMLVGSARSVPGFNLYEAINECSSFLHRFGGHQFAAGLSLKKENFEAFRAKFEDVVRQRISPEMLIPAVEYDVELPLEMITPNFIKTLDRFGPFGPSNMKPRFVSRNCTLSDDTRIVGKDHLKLSIRLKTKKKMDAIAFKMGHFQDFLKNGKPFDICYVPEINVWNGYSNIQLNIRDIKVYD